MNPCLHVELGGTKENIRDSYVNPTPIKEGIDLSECPRQKQVPYLEDLKMTTDLVDHKFSVKCDVVDVDACHSLIGQLWQFEFN